MTRILVAITIMISFIFLIILVLNMEEKSKIIKNSFIIFMIIFFLGFFVINELIMDYLLSIVLRYFFFPSFSSIILTVLISMVGFIYVLSNSKLNDKYRILNYIFMFLIIVGYVILMILDVDVNSYSSLYTGINLKCLRYISRTFILWMIVIFSIKYYNFIIKRR